MINTIILDRYKILNKIGSGGSADVYLALDLKLDRKVAIKILSKIYSSERNFVTRFKKEAQILAHLNNPNIVLIYDWGQFEDSYFICMEYVEGQSLEEIIDRQGIISPELTAKYSIQICNALEVAHKNNLIHRDIKPQNIIITPNGTVKLTDFGIAKSLIEDNTKTLNILGTAYYISPEQAQGKTLSYATDIYSLGIVMYEMLTADLPFRGDNSIEISLKHINEKPLSPSKLVGNIPLEIEKIIMHCLEKNPQDRYENISALKSDLQNFLDKKPILSAKEIKEEKNPYSKSIFNKNKFFRFNLRNNKKNYSYNYVFSKDELKEKQIKKNINDNKFILNKKFLINLSIPYVLFTVFLVLFVVFFINYNNLKINQNIITVPIIEKMDYNNAKLALQSLGLVINKKLEEYNNDIPLDYVISQEPKFGKKVTKGETINVVVSKGKEIKQTTMMPNLIGLNIDVAKKIINETGLKIEQISNESSDFFSKDIVISQEPLPEKEINKNESIKIIVSSGPSIIIIPDVIGYDYLYAASQLESMGLHSIVSKIPNQDYQPGKVLNIFPPAGSQARVGDIVNLFISTTEQMLQLPDVTQITLSKAESILQNLNIYYDVSYIDSQYEIQKNLVLSQYPTANTFISLNEKVILFVGK